MDTAELTFTPGQRVKYTGILSGNLVGRVGTVVRYSSPTNVQVKFDNLDAEQGVYPSNITLDEAKWVLGDQPVGTRFRYDGLPNSWKGVWEVTEQTTNPEVFEGTRTRAKRISRDDGGFIGNATPWFSSARAVDLEWSSLAAKPLQQPILNPAEVPLKAEVFYIGTKVGKWEGRGPRFFRGAEAHNPDQDKKVLIWWGQEDQSDARGHGSVGVYEWITPEEWQNFSLTPATPANVVLSNFETKVIDGKTVEQTLREATIGEIELALWMNLEMAKVKRLEAEVERLRRGTHDALVRENEIRDYFIEIKESHGWCDGGFNRHLEALGMEEYYPEREYEVEVTCTFSTTVTVTASDEDQARDMVSDDIEAYVPPPRYESWTETEVGGASEA